MVRRTENGWELEADLRHAEIVIEQLGLTEGNTVSTPGTAAVTPVTADDDDIDEETGLLSSSHAMLYSAIAARCN